MGVEFRPSGMRSGPVVPSGTNSGLNMVCDMRSVYCSYSHDLRLENEAQRSSHYVLSKCLVRNPGLLLLSVLWMMLADKCSLFILEIMYIMLFTDLNGACQNCDDGW